MRYNTNETKKAILDSRLIAILRKIPEDALPNVCEALLRGGVRVLEITCDHTAEDPLRALEEALSTVRKQFGDELHIGAGTILNCEEVDCASENGAELIVSPNSELSVIRYTKELGLVSCPGAMTPTEICAACNAGADFVKLFPAEQLGIGYIKAIRAPLGHIPLLAVGGADENNAGDFLRAGVSGIGVGGKLLRKDLIAAKDWKGLEELARKFVAALHK